MTLLQKAYETLQQDNVKKTKEFTLKIERPSKEVSFNPFNIPQVRSVKCTKEKLSKVLAFIDMKKYSRFSDGYTVMNIACTSKKLLSMCGSEMNVSNLIKYMKMIGLLADYDETYQFNGFYNKLNKSKSYVYNKDTEDKIKEYCIINNINKYKIKNNRYNTIVKKFEDVKSFEQSEVRFSSKLHLMKPANWSKSEFEDYLTMNLYENYPQFEYYQSLADEINETYFAEDYDRQVQFTPKFTWNKGETAVTKIGIRATNSCVSAKKEKEECDEDWIVYREDLLNRYNLSYEFDVKSSVPRVTYLLSNGKWLDNNIDLYERMFNLFVKLCPSEKLEWNKETRKIFKSFHMRGYFDTYAMLSAHTKRAISLKGDYKRDEWSNLDYVMKAYKDSIAETIGELKYDSEIFFHESCMYLDVLKSLLDDGFDVLQIYDGFYTDKECKDIEERISNITEAYYNKYINNNKDKIINNNDNNINNTIVKKFNEYETTDDYIDSLAIEALDLQDEFVEKDIKYKILE